MVCRKALEQVIKKSLSLELLKSCYPNLALTLTGMKSLQTARQQIIKFWHTNSLNEFDLIFAERNVEEKLNELDEIIQLAQYRKSHKTEKPVQLDKLTSDDIMESTLLSYSNESIENLTMIYNQLRIDNTELYEKLKSLSDSGEEVKLNIEEQLRSLDKEIETLDLETEKLQLDKLIDEFVKG